MPPIQLPILNSSSDVLNNITPNYQHLVNFPKPDFLAERTYRPLSLTFIEYLDGKYN
ncbi:unnamed protein product, partial [Rotaria magnacalcarata]